jgi:hypothetical protein
MLQVLAETIDDEPVCTCVRMYVWMYARTVCARARYEF